MFSYGAVGSVVPGGELPDACMAGDLGVILVVQCGPAGTCFWCF